MDYIIFNVKGDHDENVKMDGIEIKPQFTFLIVQGDKMCPNSNMG